MADQNFDIPKLPGYITEDFTNRKCVLPVVGEAVRGLGQLLAVDPKLLPCVCERELEEDELSTFPKSLSCAPPSK